MKFFTIAEAANLLSIKKISHWFYSNKSNPLEIVSNTKIEKVSGKWMIPESVINAFLDFKANYITTKEVSQILSISILDIELMINKEYITRFFIINKTYYIHKQEALDLTKDSLLIPSYYSVSQVAKELSLDKTTISDYVKKGKFPGSIFYKFAWYIPKSALENYKKDSEPQMQ